MQGDRKKACKQTCWFQICIKDERKKKCNKDCC